MAYVLSSISGNLISAASAGYAPTNSADVSAIASSYQVVSATATQLYAGTAYVTSINDAPISASRAGNAANASMATSAYYDGTGRLISALPDSATVSAIASSYAESAASGKQDALTFGYDTANAISSIDGSSLAGGGIKVSPSGTLWISGESAESTDSAFIPGVATATFVQSGGSFSITDAQPLTVAGANKVTIQDANWFDGTLYVSGNGMRVSSVEHTGQDWPQTFTAEAPISIGSNSFLWVNKYSAFSAGTSPDQVVPLAHASALPTYQYDAEDKISAINGSAIAGGGGLVTAIGTSESGITSLNNSGLVDTAALRSADYSSLYVQEPLYISASGDSSYIGISGGTQVNADWAETASAAPSYIENKPDLVDIVAGPGIVIDNPDGNTLRVSTEVDAETVLWDGNGTPAKISNLVLSESVKNFERVRITFSSDLPGGSPPEKNIQDVERPTANGDWFSVVFSGGIATNLFHLYTGVFAFTTNGTKFTYHSIFHCWGHGSGSYEESSTSIKCLKVVGIHRINGGN